MVRLDGRVLQREKVLTHYKTFQVGHEADFSREVTREKCITAVRAFTPLYACLSVCLCVLLSYACVLVCVHLALTSSGQIKVV